MSTFVDDIYIDVGLIYANSNIEINHILDKAVMKIEHLGIWVDNLEVMRQFYLKYFDLVCGEKYINEKKNFTSYFLSFGESRTRIELMTRPDIKDIVGERGFSKGLAHFAICVKDKNTVNDLTERLRGDGYTIASEPRTTGDGYYESVVLDPENNYVEISTE